MLIVAAVLVALALSTAGLLMFEHYSGENPLLDRVYESRLRRVPLSELDERNRRNPRRADVTISLTTLPSRIGRLEPTVKSLLNQTVSPAAIRLNVPSFSRREQRAYDIPEWLRAVRSIALHRTDDYGPATKFVPALADASPDTRIIVVDDDRIYHRWFVEQMVRESDAHPDVAIVASGWDSPPDFVDRPSTLAATVAGRAPVPIKCTRVRGSQPVDIMQGFSGYLVKRRFFDFDALVDYRGAPDAAFLVDDVWISAHCQAPKMIFKGRRTNFQSQADTEFYQQNGLGRANRGDGRPETRNNTIMLRYFKQRWKVSNP